VGLLKKNSKPKPWLRPVSLFARQRLYSIMSGEKRPMKALGQGIRKIMKQSIN